MTTLFQTYEPLLRQFCNDTIEIDIGDNFSSIFIPHSMPNYFSTDRKIFYFGRDTYGWKPTEFLMRCYKNNDLEKYVDESTKWAHDFGFLEYNKNKSSGFWTMAMRLHLRIKGQTENLRISEYLPEEYYELINDFGWGNTNSIEVPASLVNQGIWANLDKGKYWQIKEKSKPFDKLIHTIQIFEPSLVFIFNWDCEEYLLLENLDCDTKNVDLVNGHFLDITHKQSGTKIIWTVHPTRARWLGYGTDSIIDEILDYLQTQKYLE